MPDPRLAPDLGKPDNRIHFASPGDDRADIRAAAPMGFSRAVFQANAPHLKRIAAAQANYDAYRRSALVTSQDRGTP